MNNIEIGIVKIATIKLAMRLERFGNNSSTTSQQQHDPQPTLTGRSQTQNKSPKTKCIIRMMMVVEEDGSTSLVQLKNKINPMNVELLE